MVDYINIKDGLQKNETFLHDLMLMLRVEFWIDRMSQLLILSKVFVCMKKFLPYILVILVAYYIFPLFVKDTGSGMLFLLLIIPFASFLCAMIYSLKHSFNIFFVLCFSLLFIPTIYIFYNESAWIYVALYGIIAFLGSLIGVCIRRVGWFGKK